MIKYFLLITFLFSFTNFNSIAQQLAFPGADGFGKYSTGGRGGSVYYVTDTTDNPSNPTVGSLRYGLTKLSGARTILFKISGLISLKSDIKITNDNVTIAGQSAPGDGICISNYTLRVLANNVIVRFIRSRLGDITSYIDDAMDGNGSVPVSFHDIIIDHCSFSWSIDEVASFYDNKNFTMQWCILSESLYHSVDPKGNHGYAGIWGGQNATFHHNLLAHNSSRNPRFCGSRYTGDSVNEIVDMRNNVIYNWGNVNSAYGGEGGNQNIVNNYFKPGPATPGSLTTSSTSNKRNRILNYTSYYYASDAKIYPDTVWGGKFYIDGNYVDGYSDVSADNLAKGVQPDSYTNASTLIARNKQITPFNFGGTITQTALDAYKSVLDSVGAILPRRDTLDKRILNETKNGTASYEGSGYSTVTSTGVSHPSGIIDSQNDVGGWPTYSSTTAPTDTDGDGIPDWWETMNNLNSNNASDGNNIATDGYTQLEEYLNAIPSADTQIKFTGINVTKISSTSSQINFTVNWAKENFIYGLFRSTDSINFTKIAEISSNVNAYQYQINDTQLPSSNVYYYVASYPKNRTDTVLSNIVKLSLVTAVSSISNNSQSFNIYPNPCSNNIFISFESLFHSSSLKILSSDGMPISSFNLNAGTSLFNYNTSKLKNGIYYAELIDGNNIQTKQFVRL